MRERERAFFIWAIFGAGGNMKTKLALIAAAALLALGGPALAQNAQIERDRAQLQRDKEKLRADKRKARADKRKLRADQRAAQRAKEAKQAKQQPQK